MYRFQPVFIFLFEFKEIFTLHGSIIVQCVTSLVTGLVVSVVDPQPGETIVDGCAAPGGKTLYMASHLSGQGTNCLRYFIKSLNFNFFRCAHKYFLSFSFEEICFGYLLFS